ncbi:glutamyl-tRNA reductase [Luteimonas wenzhouensis]|jgi:glutamyl-tRNA reductase|uniref:Glutamyl-tRNA reductase n=1 Tax=Luteimonas wenzhouensis TaxID=2599615 RepID=A0A5C5U7M6_9GAMM|nr:glutamyl-tRNA reductase [Luteimonas wenzhouensis]NLW97473.1 glutamyl-tRNA reductase [Xanthomonadaceae bacterium]TWT21926.1 glutamyl-tRNA reductase [Luteimonas wenzhouensis]
MTLYALGINHQTAPVALREQVAFAERDVPAALADLRALPGVREVALLSTCNRTELYASADDDAALARWLASHRGGDGDLHGYLYRHAGDGAARHLFRVACGLDSMVLGEPQILGQVKQAWSMAREAGALGSELDRLFQHAFVTAKRVRTETRIGSSPVSVASLAVRLAQESFARPDDSVALLVGAGETIELAARHLAQSRVKRLLIANRTYRHAQDLAERHGAVALPLEELEHHLFMADVVFSATASQIPVLTRAQVERALSLRKRKPMMLMDLAVPRDIEPAVAELEDAYLYTVDDLDRVVEQNRRSRGDAAQEAETIVDLQVARYGQALALGARNEPLKRLRAHGEAARAELAARARQQLALGHDPAAVVEQLAHSLTNRLLHVPTAALRDAAAQGNLDLLRAFEPLLPPLQNRDDAADPAP